MLHDSLIDFLQVGSNLSCVGATGASFASNVIDILGVGVGVAPTNIIGVPNALFGQDTGIGFNTPDIYAVVGTAFATANSATLTMAFQAAPDTGAGGNYLPGTWQTLSQTAAMTAAQLIAAQDIRMDWPVSFPDNLSPRFLRLLFITPAATNFSAGTISYAITTLGRPDQANKYANRNFSLA